MILSEFAAEPWLMEPGRLQGFLARIADLTPHIAAVARIEIQRPAAKLNIVDGVAVIPISGVLLKKVPDWFSLFGIEASAYSQITEQIGQAAAAREVNSIRLEIDSPGGTVAGVLEAAQAIRAAGESKPVTAHVQDLAASAAYWLASQAQSISASLNAEVGSIGVYTVYHDLTRMAESIGVKVHVIATGEHKGMGVPGAPITDSQIAAVREVIEAIGDNFVAAVAAGRGLSSEEARALATGRLWEAKAALANRLIDAIGETQSASLESQIKNHQSSIPERDPSMGNEKEKPQAVDSAPTVDLAKVRAEAAEAERKRLADLQVAFPDDAAFAMEQFAAGHDVTQAKAAYCDVLAQRLEQPEPDEYQHGGYTDSQPAGTATGGFLRAVRDYARDHKCSKVEAIKAVKADNPKLYDEFRAQSRPPMVHGRCKRVAV
jgi:signal peptide peptidase SppA